MKWTRSTGALCIHTAYIVFLGECMVARVWEISLPGWFKCSVQNMKREEKKQKWIKLIWSIRLLVWLKIVHCIVKAATKFLDGHIHHICSMQQQHEISVFGWAKHCNYVVHCTHYMMSTEHIAHSNINISHAMRFIFGSIISQSDWPKPSNHSVILWCRFGFSMDRFCLFPKRLTMKMIVWSRGVCVWPSRRINSIRSESKNEKNTISINGKHFNKRRKKHEQTKQKNN